MPPETVMEPTKFNPRGQYIAYAGQGRATVYVQNGYLFSEQGEDLMFSYLNDPDRGRFKNILYWMNFMGYAMNAELRTEVIKLRREQELQERMKAEMARLDEMQAAEMAQLERELAEAQRKARLQTLGPLPPSPVQDEIPELELTETERAILGDVPVSLDEPEFEEYEPEPEPVAVLPAPARRVSSTRKR